MNPCWQGLSSRTLLKARLFERIAIAVAAFGILATAYGFAQEVNPVTASARAGLQPSEQLLPIPKVAFDSARYRATPEELRQIEALIDRIREIDSPDYGFAPFMIGHQFAPIEGSGRFNGGILMKHGLKTNPAVAQLVALGPKSLRKLLERLTDETPTRLVMQGADAQWYAREIPMSAAHPTETRVRMELAEILTPAKRDRLNRLGTVARHKITTGDVCFVIVGQIVNRAYQASRYQPSNCRVINSPTHDPNIAEVVRALWKADDSPQMLFNSLLTDLHTRKAASLQADAAMRLLYFFPNESSDLIATRIKSIDVSRPSDNADPFVSDDEEKLIRSVRTAKHPIVVEALVQVIQKAQRPPFILAAASDAVVEAEPEIVYKRLREIVVAQPPNGYWTAQTLNTAVRLFPQRSKELFDTYRGDRDTLETRVARIEALRNPTQSRPWMVEFLESLLGDKSATDDVYGPEWDPHPVRVCDLAAKALADFHLPKPVRFEFEENPAFLTAQISKLRRVVAGEANVSFELPPAVVMPKDLPTRKAKRFVDLPEDYGSVHAVSNDQELWIGDGFQGRGGWAYDSVKINAETGKVVERVPLDQWKGGVSLLENGQPDRAYCYHGYEGGNVLVRDVRTGWVVKKVETPFHDGVAFNDPLQVRDLGDVTMSGKDGRWILAITDDGALHSIDTETGEHRCEWTYTGKKGELFFGKRIIGLQGGSKVLLEGIGETIDNSPVRIWEQATRKMTVAEKMPERMWQGGWGNLAWSSQYEASLWNLATHKQIRLPRSDEAIELMACDTRQSVMFALRSSGAIDAFRVIDGERAKPLVRLISPTTEAAASTRLIVSSDNHFLLWQGSPRRVDEDGNPMESNRTFIAVFEIADLTN